MSFIVINNGLINTSEISHIVDKEFQACYPIGIYPMDGCTIYFRNGKELFIEILKSKDIFKMINELEKDLNK